VIVTHSATAFDSLSGAPFEMTSVQYEILRRKSPGLEFAEYRSLRRAEKRRVKRSSPPQLLAFRTAQKMTGVFGTGFSDHFIGYRFLPWPPGTQSRDKVPF
jgi:hypothetical protein